mmetsp:Transcript_54706/g.127619  ORF Transcript_54706/g.127619 Transcript_54706/m.127619 type:complete len:302 (+) Transcript_54706:353-1258(+)
MTQGPGVVHNGITVDSFLESTVCLLFLLISEVIRRPIRTIWRLLPPAMADLELLQRPLWLVQHLLIRVDQRIPISVGVRRLPQRDVEARQRLHGAPDAVTFDLASDVCELHFCLIRHHNASQLTEHDGGRLVPSNEELEVATRHIHSKEPEERNLLKRLVKLLLVQDDPEVNMLSALALLKFVAQPASRGDEGVLHIRPTAGFQRNPLTLMFLRLLWRPGKGPAVEELRALFEDLLVSPWSARSLLCQLDEQMLSLPLGVSDIPLHRKPTRSWVHLIQQLPTQGPQHLAFARSSPAPHDHL